MSRTQPAQPTRTRVAPSASQLQRARPGVISRDAANVADVLLRLPPTERRTAFKEHFTARERAFVMTEVERATGSLQAGVGNRTEKSARQRPARGIYLPRRRFTVASVQARPATRLPGSPRSIPLTATIPDALPPAQTAVTVNPQMSTLDRMTEHNPDTCASLEVTVRCQDDPTTWVRLFDHHLPDDYSTSFAVEVRADGLQARLDAVETSVWDREDVTAFLDRLVADFRGWDGERTWSTPHLGLRAIFQSGGHIGLTWTFRPGTIAASWEAAVTTWVEGGEQLAALAADVRQFLSCGWPDGTERPHACEKGSGVRDGNPA
ncbi:DUF6228 family protein [Streptomyces sp. NPDC050161]|uniref:DUF6228 family protein n=1 Tax=Streptomyces sp. NPDC050161 TaxID=3365604 RepID=UPI0037B2AAAB